ncbi:E3 ubiquitin-protein ligase RNF25 [Gasterosteus aculeatus]|uniref:E3 ubiquitin-protein ligase RNF25 isoform X2 n=1 Tax=Gasterosteus aculeatus aculeatus TaxID=481459 RepID=UPI001A985A48|nr:E3 ubiquitin-protein ligase RNF25 isoform X2 [Gasterosteus aculeatus aculeatus]
MAAECDVTSEIEVLQSIYLEELLVNRREDGDWEVSLVLYPSTAEDSVSQFVRLTLTLTLDQQYPSTSPAISIHNPRGLSDDKISSVQKCLQLEAQSCLGSPVLYQLIEKAKEILTESNIPHGNCVICLYGFKEGETFSKTSCYHYFHSHCLGRYARHSEQELRQRKKELEEDKTRERAERQELTVVCPVCREPLTYDVDQLLCSPAPQPPELDQAALGSHFQQKWFELQKLLERQKSKGGIIDPEEEAKRFLIHTNEPPPTADNEHQDPSPATQRPSAPNACSHELGASADHPVPGLSHGRGSQGPRRHQQGWGPRRGGRSRPQHRRAAPPIAEHLDKLSLTSDRPQGPHMRVDAQASQSKTGRSLCAEQLGAPGSPEGLLGGRVSPEAEGPHNAADGRGHRGRRRGPHRPEPNTGGRYYWDGRASNSRGGPSNPYRRGGPRWGHDRDFQHKVVERERRGEEVL